MKILKNMKRKIDFETLSCKYFANCEGINQYLNDIRKYTKMTPDEEEALFARYMMETSLPVRKFSLGIRGSYILWQKDMQRRMTRYWIMLEKETSD